MKRAELEAMSTAALQLLIQEGVSILAARANAEFAAPAATSSAPVASPLSVSPDSSPTNVFTFGAAASAGTGSGSSMFAPASRTGEGASSAGKLFGGTGGGLFGGAGLGSSATAAVSSGGLFGGAGLGSSATTAASSGGLFGSLGAPAYPGSSATASDKPAAVDKDTTAGAGDEDDEYVKEEEVTTIDGWTPSISLEVCSEVKTGEEDDEQIYAQRSKLYRWRDGEWKERGLGEARLLKNKATGHVRFLMRQEKTGKVVANHLLVEHSIYCDLRPNADSEKIWVWMAQDYADTDAGKVEEQLALKFGTVELARAFKEAFDSAKKQNAEVQS